MRHHIAISAVTGAASWYLTGSPVFAASLFVSGVFIDLDHVLDYYIHEKKVSLDVRDFFAKCYNIGIDKFYCIFHSYELFILALPAALFFKSPLLWGGLAGGAVHLAFDLIYNPVQLMTYSFIYRWKNNFDIDRFLRTGRPQNNDPKKS